MSLNQTTTTVDSGEMPTFTLPKDKKGKERDVLVAKREQHNYEMYQQQYKRMFGVYPELDKLNDPVCALAAASDHVFLPEKLDTIVNESKKKARRAIAASIGNIALETAGVGSVLDDSNMENIASLTGTEFYTVFRSEFEDAIRKYKYAYSLILNLDFSYASNMSDCECISDGLGYKKSGNYYYEGTWENGLMTYGLMWVPGISYAFIGTFDENMIPDEGVSLVVTKTGYEVEAGLFTLVDFNNTDNIGTLTALHGLRITVDSSANLPISMAAGGFENDEYNGTVYFYGVDRKRIAYFAKGEFDYGDEVKSKKTTSSGKNRTVALLLCLFLGIVGAHHFYEGRVGKGILYLFTWGLFGIGALIDLIKYITNKM